MSHSVKRAKSKFEQFRMVVPRDIRHIVGKTAWTRSLATSDPLIAANARAQLIAKYTAEIRRIRTEIDQGDVIAALALLDRAFTRLAEARGSMDAAIAQQLHLLATVVIDSWSTIETSNEVQPWGDFFVAEPADAPEPIPVIDTAQRSVFQLRIDFLEGRGIADGFVYRELATLLLERRVFKPIWFAVSYMTSIEPRLRLDRDDVYTAVAEAYLRRLADHAFTSWPADVHLAVGKPLTSREAKAPPVAGILAKSTIHPGLLGMPLTEALCYWREQRQPRASAVNEATRSVDRFVHVFGDLAVGDIDRDIMIEFRNLVADIPPQTELAKIVAAGRTLREVVAEARATRQAWEDGGRHGPRPDRLAPGSVKKDIGAISAILGKVQADLGNGNNVAARIEIAGYSKTRNKQKRPRLPFTPEMMQRLFDSPLFTGCAGKSDASRQLPGTRLYQDELYWSFLFGAVGGPRLGEIGQISLSDVSVCDLRRTFGKDFEGSCTVINITGTGDDQHVKNDVSERYLVLHDRLIELGFNDYVAHRRAAGKKRLFDLTPDEDGNFVKELSRRLNRYIDAMVTDDRRYVFHSMRHEFTDRADLSSMPTRVANSIKGHANLTEGDKYGQVSISSQYVHLKRLKLDFIDWPRLKNALARSNLLLS